MRSARKGFLIGMLAAVLVFVLLVFTLIAYAAYLTHDPHEDAREKLPSPMFSIRKNPRFEGHTLASLGGQTGNVREGLRHAAGGGL